MKIGMTFRHDMPLLQIVHGNGISQNIKFLYDLLENLGHEPFFMHFSEAGELDNLFSENYRALSFNGVIRQKLQVPVVLEIAVTLNPEHRGPLREVCGSKIVSVRFGNSMIMDIEELVFKGENGGLLHVGSPDALWISPHFYQSKSYFESIYSVEADYCPYLWEPDFVSAPFNKDDRPKIRDIYVMEPNVNVMKTSIIPLCIISALCEQAADKFGKAFVVNGDRFTANAYALNNILANLPGTTSDNDKVFFTPRCTFDEAFQRPDVLLGHQWACELNYLYLEALYRGVSLVHNSESLREVGYYYEDFDVGTGLEQCEKALSDKRSIGASVKRNHKYLEQFSTKSDANLKGYEMLLEKVLTA